MAENSKIAWCDGSLNFWHGCVKVSPGCQNCYAETLSKRYGRDIWGPAKTTGRMKTKGPWKDCLKWDREAQAEGIRRRVFVMSMGDFFEDHPQVEPWRREAFPILEGFKALDVQLLTKRPENVLDMVPGNWLHEWPEHVWMGTSVENQAMANKRIPELVRIPAKIHFLSVEPMLGPIRLVDFDAFWRAHSSNTISWVIVGGESGPNHRPMEIQWVEDIVYQCKFADVPVFVKQDSGLYPGRQGRIPDELFIREFPG